MRHSISCKNTNKWERRGSYVFAVFCDDRECLHNYITYCRIIILLGKLFYRFFFSHINCLISHGASFLVCSLWFLNSNFQMNKDVIFYKTGYFNMFYNPKNKIFNVAFNFKKNLLIRIIIQRRRTVKEMLIFFYYWN